MHHVRERHLKTCTSIQERFLTQLSLSSVDYNHLVKFEQAIESNYPINVYRVSDNYQGEHSYGRVLIEDKKLFDDLGKYGVVPNKTFIKTFPYMVPKQYYLDVIRGIFDADGCLSYHLTKHGAEAWEFNIVGTKELLESIADILQIPCKLTKRYPERDNNNYTLRGSGVENTYKIMEKLYGEAPVYLDRKYERYLHLKTYLNGRAT